MEKNIIDLTFREKIENIPGLPSEVGWNSNKGWQDYERQFPIKKFRGTRALIYMISAAAVIFMVCISILVTLNHRNETQIVTNDSGSIMEVLLPDGNRIWLNTNSTVEYPSDPGENPFEVNVEGEAYFEIFKPQKLFYKIRAHNAIIIAENTSAFNIRARKEEENVNITVAEGVLKIQEVSYQEGLALLVTKGNYCSVHVSQNLIYSSVNTDENFLAWKTGRLTFNSMPIATVTDILGDYYNLQFELADGALAYCLFSGTFQDQSIDNVLYKIQSDLDFEIRNEGKKIIISGKGCLKL